MSEILNTDRGTYDLSKRRDVYAYFCQNFGFGSRDMSLLERFIIEEFEALCATEEGWRVKARESMAERDKLQEENKILREALEKAYAETSWPLSKGILMKALDKADKLKEQGE